jgi:UDP-glucose 6-dehydrogenase
LAFKIGCPSAELRTADLSQLFAVVDDYRNNKYQAKNSDKVLVIKGTSMCANVEIHNGMDL